MAEEDVQRAVAGLLEVAERLRRLEEIAFDLKRLLETKVELFDVQLERAPDAYVCAYVSLRPLRPIAGTAFAKLIAATDKYAQCERLMVKYIELKTWPDAARIYVAVVSEPLFWREYTVWVPARGRVRERLVDLLALTLIEEGEWRVMIDKLSEKDAGWCAPLEALKSAAAALKNLLG